MTFSTCVLTIPVALFVVDYFCKLLMHTQRKKMLINCMLLTLSGCSTEALNAVTLIFGLQWKFAWNMHTLERMEKDLVSWVLLCIRFVSANVDDNDNTNASHAHKSMFNPKSIRLCKIIFNRKSFLIFPLSDVCLAYYNTQFSWKSFQINQFIKKFYPRRHISVRVFGVFITFRIHISCHSFHFFLSLPLFASLIENSVHRCNTIYQWCVWPNTCSIPSLGIALHSLYPYPIELQINVLQQSCRKRKPLRIHNKQYNAKAKYLFVRLTKCLFASIESIDSIFVLYQ